MKTIKQNELYKNLSRFLEGKGIELKDGSVTTRIRQGCSLLTDTINLAHNNLEKAKTRVDQKLDRMRQAIHEKTAPKRPGAPPPAAAKPAGKPQPAKVKSRRKKATPARE